MRNEMRLCALVAIAVGIGLSASGRAQAEHDLDALSPEALDAALDAELDDVTEVAENEGAMEAAFLKALGDDGDSADPLEQTIAWADLVAEMKEADTTVAKVVHDAVHESKPAPSAPPDDDEQDSREDAAPQDSGGRGWLQAAREMLSSKLSWLTRGFPKG